MTSPRRRTVVDPFGRRRRRHLLLLPVGTVVVLNLSDGGGEGGGIHYASAFAPTFPRVRVRTECVTPSPQSFLAAAITTASTSTEVVELALDYETVNQMKFRQLQKECKSRGIPAVGTTDVLRGRLIVHLDAHERIDDDDDDDDDARRTDDESGTSPVDPSDLHSATVTAASIDDDATGLEELDDGDDAIAAAVEEIEEDDDEPPSVSDNDDTEVEAKVEEDDEDEKFLAATATDRRSDDDGGIGTSIGPSSTTNDATISSNPNTTTKRKANRKKYWHAQQVETLIRTKQYDSAVVRAESMMDELNRLAVTAEDASYKPDARNYAALLDAYAKCSSTWGQNGKGRRMRTFGRNNGGFEGDGGGDGENDDRTHPAIKAEEVLRSMIRTADAFVGNDQVKRVVRPNVVHYTSVVDAYAKANDADIPDSAERAERILFEMLERCDEQQQRQGQEKQEEDQQGVDDNGDGDGIELGENSDDEMGDAAAAPLAAVAPTSITFDAVLNAYAKRGTYESAQRAEALLTRMESMDKQRQLTPLQQQKQQSLNGDATLTAGATDTTLEMKPTSYSYATVASAWAKCAARSDGIGGSEAAERAESILNRVMELHDEQSAKWEVVANELAGNDGEEEVKEEETTAKPTAVLFNAVIDAWSRSGDPRGGTKAEELLNQMEELYRSTGDEEVKPDVVSYNSVLNCWSNSGHVNAAKNAERVFKKMALPSLSSSDGGSDGVSSNAGGDSDDNDDDAMVRPNRVSFNTVINCWAKSALPGSVQRAQQILLYMIRSYQGGNRRVKPDVVSFSTVMNAWAKSKEPDKAERARSILQRMIELNLRPNEISYNTVLNAAAFSAFADDEDERRRALAVAVTTFNDMRDSPSIGVEPDSVTYGNMLKCCANLMPPGDARTTMSTRLFESCRNAGQVGDLVLNEARRAMPTDVFLGLVGGGVHNNRSSSRRRRSTGAAAAAVQLSDLPREWYRNVREAKVYAARKKTDGASAAAVGAGGRNNKGKRFTRKPDGRGDKAATRRRRRMEPAAKPPQHIRPMRRIVESSWESGKDL